MPSNALRITAAGLLAAVAVLSGAFGLLIAAKVFDDYKDSPDSTYLLIGGMVLVVAAGLANAAWRVARGHGGSVWPALTLAGLVLVVLFVLTTSPVVLALLPVLLIAATLAALASRRKRR